MFDLSLEVLRVVEQAAIASARTMGFGDGEMSDRVAVESMLKSCRAVASETTLFAVRTRAIAN